MYYDKRNRETISKLNPVVQEKVKLFLKELENIGEDVLIYSGMRSIKEQNELYARGRTKSGRIVTYVKGGYSLHNYGVAFDLVPTTLRFLQWGSFRRYREIARVANSIGFDWGFAMWGFDKPHFQYTQGLTIEDFRSGKTLKKPRKRTSKPSKLARTGYAAKRKKKRLQRKESPKVTARRKKRLQRKKRK